MALVARLRTFRTALPPAPDSPEAQRVGSKLWSECRRQGAGSKLALVGKCEA
jgi:hypothetical protein